MKVKAEDLSEFFRNVCPACMGSGELRVMQSYMTYDAGTIRGPDTKITCPFCKGTGKRNKTNE